MFVLTRKVVFIKVAKEHGVAHQFHVIVVIVIKRVDVVGFGFNQPAVVDDKTIVKPVIDLIDKLHNVGQVGGPLLALHGGVVIVGGRLLQVTAGTNIKFQPVRRTYTLGVSAG